MPRNPKPWTQFHHFDFKNDDELALCSLAAQGLWIRALCFMWANDTDRFEGTIHELAMTVRQIDLLAVEVAVRELLKRKVCEGEIMVASGDCPVRVRLVSRRLSREVTQRESERKRKADYRAREMSPDCPDECPAHCPGNVPLYDSVHGSDSCTGEEESEGKGAARAARQPKGDWPGFDAFWAPYPNKKDRKGALKAWNKLKPDEALTATILAHVERAAREDDDWLRGFAPHGQTYLNGERWTDPIKRAGNGAASRNGHRPLTIETHPATDKAIKEFFG